MWQSRLAPSRSFGGREHSLDARSNWWLNITLRLKPGQDIEAATVALRGMQP
jgi:hypothetical protein